MKKLLLPLLLLGVTGTLSAQQNGFSRQSSSKARLENYSMNTPRVTCGIDYSDYPYEKAIGDTIWNYVTTSTVSANDLNGFGQYFEAPQPLVIGGGLFIGIKTVPGAATIRMSIYNAGPDYLPTGTALATKDTVISAVNSGLVRVQVPFSTPVTVTGNYVITVENMSTVQYRFTTNNEDRNSGRGENFGCTKGGGEWFSLFSDANINADVLISPIYVTAATADFTLSATTACVGTPTTITNTSSALFNNRMYNRYKMNNFLFGTIDSTYRWTVPAGSSFGAAPTINPAAAGAVNVQLVATKKGWVSNCTETISKTVTYNAQENGAFSYPSNTYCSGAANPTPTATTPGGTYSATAGLNFVSAATGQINLATTPAGTYTVTYTTAGACPGTSTQTVTVTAASNASFSYGSNTFCSGSANPVPTTSSPGTFSATAGLTFVSTTTGEIDLANTADGTYTVTYTTSGACPGTSTQTVIVTDAPDASFTYAANAYCVDGTNPSPVFGTGAGAGTFSSTTGLSINANTGVINLAASTPGTYTVTNHIAASGSCAAADDTYDVTINALPVVTFSNSAVCASTATVTLAGAPAGGTFSGTGVTGNTFATSNGTQAITYSYTDGNGCTNTANATITVNALPTLSFTGSAVCASTATVNLTATPAGGTFSGVGVTGSTFATSNGTQTITYSYTDANNCTNTATATVTVNNTPTVAFTTLPATICVYNNPITLTGATPAGGTYSGTGVTGTTFNPTTAGLGTKTVTYTYTDGNNCSGTATANIEVSECLSVEDLVAAGNLAIYPNPASDVVTFGFSNSTVANVNVAIVSLDGKTVYQNQFQSNQGSIDVSTFARGTYMVRIQAEGKTSTAKLILN